MKSAKEIIRAILSSYGYNRVDEYMINVCKEVKSRLRKTDTWTDRTDEGNIIYGTLVCLYGEYGTSPRSGWFDGESAKIVEEIIEEIDEVIGECFNE